jgi:hypothetical protein
MGSNGVAVFESENTISDEEVRKDYALYPYNDKSYGLPDYFMFSYACEAESSTKVNLPLFGTWDSENEEFAFQAAGSLLAVTVKNLPAEYTEAKLETSSGSGICLQGEVAYILYQEGVYFIDGNAPDISRSITYTLSNSTRTDQTFYFPLSSKEALDGRIFSTYENTKFTLSGEGVITTGFTIGINFSPERNKKYTKVIVFDESGMRTYDVVELTNASLETSNKASADLSGYTDVPNFIIPQNKKEGNTETVELSLSNCASLQIGVMHGSNVDGKFAPENVNINISSGEYASLNVDLPSSNVTLTSNDGYPLSDLTVEGAKAMTVDAKAVAFTFNGPSEKLTIKKTVNNLTVKGYVDEMEVNQLVENLIINGANNKMTLTFGDEGSVSNFKVTGSITLTVINNASDSISIESDIYSSVTIEGHSRKELTFQEGMLIDPTEY